MYMLDELMNRNTSNLAKGASSHTLITTAYSSFQR